MKKIILMFSLLCLAILAIFIFNNKNKKNVIYLSDNVSSTLLNEVSNGKVEFKSIFPKDSEIHEYEFKKKDLDELNSSKGIYVYKNMGFDNVEKISGTKDLTPVISKYLQKEDGVYNAHFFLSINTEKNVFNELANYFKKYIDATKLKSMNVKLDKSIKEVETNKNTNNKFVIYHNAFGYLLDKKNEVLIGTGEGQLFDGNKVRSILENYKDAKNIYLLSEKGEEVDKDVSTLISRYSNIKTKEITTFEAGLDSSDQYIKQSKENYIKLNK